MLSRLSNRFGEMRTGIRTDLPTVVGSSGGETQWGGQDSYFVAVRLLGWPALLWKMLPQVPKERPRLLSGSW